MTRDELIQHLENASNFCLGMALDPAVPQHAKEACRARSKEIDKVVQEAINEGGDTA